MIQPTPEVLSAASTGTPYVTGNFAPLMNEVTAFDLEVIGRIPEVLNGRFLRMGPNPVDEPDPSGIGHSVSELFSKKEASVFACEINPPKFGHSSGVEALRLDVTSEGDWRAAGAAVVEHSGR